MPSRRESAAHGHNTSIDALTSSHNQYLTHQLNQLDTVIAAEVNALLHRENKLMCSNVSAKSQKDRRKQLMDYRFRGYMVCKNGFLFLHDTGRKRLMI